MQIQGSCLVWLERLYKWCVWIFLQRARAVIGFTRYIKVCLNQNEISNFTGIPSLPVCLHKNDFSREILLCQMGIGDEGNINSDIYILLLDVNQGLTGLGLLIFLKLRRFDSFLLGQWKKNSLMMTTQISKLLLKLKCKIDQCRNMMICNISLKDMVASFFKQGP